jgi:hypothetical protein
MSQDIKIPSRPATGYRYRIRRVTLLLSLPICVFLNACDGGRHKAVAGSRGRPTLVAEPNPVPAGDLDQPLGSTVITWNTGTGVSGNLYVKVNRSQEVFLGRGASGTLKIDWIQFDSTYEFRLYTRKHSRLIAKLDVTRDN